jgi:hypothetical protein
MALRRVTIMDDLLHEFALACAVAAFLHATTAPHNPGRGKPVQGRIVGIGVNQREKRMLHTKRLLTAVAFGMLVAAPAFAADASAADASSMNPKANPAATNDSTGTGYASTTGATTNQTGPNSRSLTGGPAAAMGSPNSGITPAPGVGSSGGTTNGGSASK